MNPAENHFKYPWMAQAYPVERESEYKSIKQAQQFLSNAGFYRGPIDGLDSEELRAATLSAMKSQAEHPREKKNPENPAEQCFAYRWMREAYPKKDW